MTLDTAPDPAVRDALALLGVEHLLLGIHDRSFPTMPEEDTGVGSPYSAAGHAFLGFARGLGFTGIQLGPQGETDEGDPSPYNGTLFSRGCLPVSLSALATDERWRGILPRPALDAIVAALPAAEPERVHYRPAHRAHREALDRAFDEFTARRTRGDDADLDAQVRAFRQRQWSWLERDALYEVLAGAHGAAWWPQWDDALDRRLFDPAPADAAAAARRRATLLAEHAATVDRQCFAQFVVHEQHRHLREITRRLGLEVWGDLQVGFAARDAWSRQGLFLEGYALGAPPSRTNPAGQPWHYPVLDPGRPDAAASFVSARMEKLLDEYDGVRIDHPHGFVCPWVYDARDPDPQRAVQHGARLFDSPSLPDHPALARFGVARPAQLNPDPSTPRHADAWVTALEPEQVRRYGWLMTAIVDAAHRHRGGSASLACEVLSTCPYPLARVLAAHGLGRFRVTQKADLRRADDVYRSENAASADWVMVGNHDTAPIWRLLDDWTQAGTLTARAEYLAWRLVPDGRRREAFARALTNSPALLAQAQFADLLACPARNVLVFFTDAFGLREGYNQGGIVAPDNWTLRLAADYRRRYDERLAADRALNLPMALAMAVRARGDEVAGERRALVARLDALAATLRQRSGVPD